MAQIAESRLDMAAAKRPGEDEAPGAARELMEREGGEDARRIRDVVGGGRRARLVRDGELPMKRKSRVSGKLSSAEADERRGRRRRRLSGREQALHHVVIGGVGGEGEKEPADHADREGAAGWRGRATVVQWKMRLRSLGVGPGEGLFEAARPCTRVRA